MNNYKNFYDKIDRESLYTPVKEAVEHPAFNSIKKFIDTFDLYSKKCLEIGASKGVFQNMVKDYTGIDLVSSLAKYYTKPYFILNSDGTYPFEDDSFDAIWTYDVHEHIPNLQQSLIELKRILKKGGVVFFKPAWQCRSWAADGYEVRPYSQFSLKGKLIKLSIPMRDSIYFRLLYILPKRVFRHLCYLLGHRFHEILYNRIKPNYEVFWTSDSDAVNDIDPHDAILWFESNGFKVISHPLHLKAFFIRNDGIIAIKK